MGNHARRAILSSSFFFFFFFFFSLSFVVVVFFVVVVVAAVSSSPPPPPPPTSRKYWLRALGMCSSKGEFEYAILWGGGGGVKDDVTVGLHSLLLPFFF